MHIGRDARGTGEEQRETWSVTLAFDLEGLGPVRAGVSVLESQVSVNLWADKADTVSLFEQHLSELADHLEDAGLRVSQLSARQGKPADASPSGPSHSKLLDLRA
jgi:nucleotide-binding universal stress UspA family protein